MSTTASPPAPTTPPIQSQTYTGSCHCARFQYTVTTSPPLNHPDTEVIDCNCSICARNAYLLIYVPDDDITFNTGSFDSLSKYTFNKHKLAHYFCPSCGTSCFAKSTDQDLFADVKAVNVRTFAGLDVKSLRIKSVDGRNF